MAREPKAIQKVWPTTTIGETPEDIISFFSKQACPTSIPSPRVILTAVFTLTKLYHATRRGTMLVHPRLVGEGSSQR
jgi:hypothetical protein